MTSPRLIDSFFNITYKDSRDQLVCRVENENIIHEGLPDRLIHVFRRHGKSYLLDSPNTKAVLYSVIHGVDTDLLESTCLTSMPNEYWMAIPTKEPFIRKLVRCACDMTQCTHVAYCSFDRSSSTRVWTPVYVSVMPYE